MSNTPTTVAEAPAAPAPPAAIPPAPPRRNWLGRILTVLCLAALFLPSLLFGDDGYWLPVFTKYAAIALFALSVDLIWGYTGLLSLGQGLYFGMGVYAVGYSLHLQKALEMVNRDRLENGLAALPPGTPVLMPDGFMIQGRLEAVPDWIAPFMNIWVALAVAVLLPLLVAAVFGFVSFRRRIKGVYFSLITQALLLAAFTLVDNQLSYTGGRVGMPGLAKLTLFGHRFVLNSMYLLVVVTLVVCFLVCSLLVHSKFGRVLTAIRDNEYRILALGYDTALYKTFIFALSGALAGLAGALYVSALGTAGSDRLGIAFSIEVVILVAVGGRGTLIGAIIGAFLVNFINTYVSNEYQGAWPFVLGGLFVAVVVFMPEGIVGLLRKIPAWSHRALRLVRQSST